MHKKSSDDWITSSIVINSYQLLIQFDSTRINNFEDPDCSSSRNLKIKHNIPVSLRFVDINLNIKIYIIILAINSLSLHLYN